MSLSLPDTSGLTDGLTLSQELQLLVTVAQDAFTAKVSNSPSLII